MMPPDSLDLELWVSGEQTTNSAPRTFQQDRSAPNLQIAPSKRKHPNPGSSPPEQSGLKKHKSLSETDLGIIKLAAGILNIPVASLLAAQSDLQTHSDGSSTTNDSLETPSTGPEQTDGYDIPVEPTRNATRRLHQAPTSAPAFQSQAGAYGNPNAGYREPHTFHDLNVNSKNHLEWWGLNPSLMFDGFDPSTESVQQTGPPIRQEPPAQINDWDQTRFDDTVLTSGADTTEPPSWSFAPQGPYNGYHGPGQPHHIPTDPMPHPGPQDFQPPQPNRQAFGPFNFSGRPYLETRAAEIGPSVMGLTDNVDIFGTALGNQDPRPMNQPRVNEIQNQNFTLKRPRPRRAKNSGEGRKPGRRGPLTEEQRLETSLTRKKGACIRCQRQQIKCKTDPQDPDGWCITCREVSGPTLSKLSCLRYKVNDAQLIDKDTHPKFIWSKRWTSMKVVEIQDWRSSEIKTITLTQDVGGATYNLQVREFIPVEGDSLCRGWKTKGVEKRHACTPFAIANMAQTGLQMATFAEQNIDKFIKYYIDKTDKLMWNTYCMAYRYSHVVERKEERDLLSNSLKLWVASRMESRRERICGAEVLNMKPQDWDLESDNFGDYLIPPVLQAQIELLTTACVLLPMKLEVLKGLQKLMKANLTRSWFTIYLCMFLLMHSCALLTQAESLRAKREPRSSDLHPQARYYNPRLVEELHTGANILLAHFHYCNKGSHPFAMDWRTLNSSISFAELGPEQVQYMRDATEEVKRRAHKFKVIKDNKMFEDDYYFLSQIYEYDWVPTHTV